MRRGFKKEANEIATEIRDELGLGHLDPLDTFQLTDLLEIPVVPLGEFEDASELCFDHFTNVEADAFSAVTVFDGSKRIIVHNHSHSQPRQVSNLTHEVAHALLHHQPSPALDETGCRKWDEEIEREAEYLAGALLVTEAAALHIVRNQVSLRAASLMLGVSQQMVRYRINVTGAEKRVRYSKRKHGR